MKAIENYDVSPGHLAVWWLGQASFIVKSPQGIIAAIDPYLSNSCKAGGEGIGFNFDRITAPPLAPEELAGADVIVFTHSHQDHFDPDTIVPYRRAGGTGPYIAPGETADKLREMGVGDDDITLVWPNKTHTVGDLNFRATFAIPFGGDELTHVGYLISITNGPVFYFTGDTDYHEILGNSISPYKPDVMLTVINGAFRNLSAGQAAKLAKQIDPKVVIPCHYGLFPDNNASPQSLKMNLFMYDMQDRYKELEVMVPYNYPNEQIVK